MPLPLMDFSKFGYKPDYSGIGDIFQNIQQGREFVEAPEKLARERLRDQLQSQLFGEQVTGQQLKNQYTPQQMQQESELNKIYQSLYGAQAKEHEANAAMKQAEVDLLGSDYESQGGFPLQLMSPGERNQATKDMRQEQKRAQSLIKVSKTAQEMKKIIQEHPNVYKEFAAALAMADTDEASIKKTMRTKLANEKDLAAFIKLRKLAADMIFAKGDMLGRSFTDAKLELIRELKASPVNPDEANLYVLDKEIYDAAPAEAYNQAIQHGLDTRRYPALDLERYRDNQAFNDASNGMDAQTQQLSNDLQKSLQNEDEMVWVINPKTKVRKQISREAYEAAQEKNKK